MYGNSSVLSISPVINSCPGYSFPSVVCVNNHGSVLSPGFKREVHDVIGDADTYPTIQMPDDHSFQAVQQAHFVLFDPHMGPDILGPSPRLDFMFELTEVTHEGPVYVPETNELYMSRLEKDYLYQLVVDLTNDPPTLSQRMAQPPIYAGAGARYRDGLIYYATLGGSEKLGSMPIRPGIYTLNISSGHSTALLNNYYGYFFNSVDDLDISPAGDVWFTDNDYAHSTGVNSEAPQLQTATYRFTPSTGEVTMVESSLQEPNGISFSLSGSTLFLTDTGAGSPSGVGKPLQYKSTGPRTVYAFDVDAEDGSLRNKRAIYQAIEYVPDGIKVSRNGYLITAAGHGLDILAPNGKLIARILTNFTVANLAFAGRDGEQIWAVGKGGAARVLCRLRGP
ncbi:putative gluconolactonase precursor [Xylona heveae TC161]|uniref:Putative gluconolactonase n=1 Tax=Xylona heveae (strain CBS 132557 / TC161) TaxID=1328760 RepID=A0A165FGX6_XYLHT|nr:putative gluconolactonase precursor [Xylona heveae TC161]KZF20966.1 putative gluconolactonase precursor [Xylona heveae TC161]